jgi:hypothetical protein
MAHINVIHDPIGETLTVYWDNPDHRERTLSRTQGTLAGHSCGSNGWMTLVKSFYSSAFSAGRLPSTAGGSPMAHRCGGRRTP